MSTIQIKAKNCILSFTKMPPIKFYVVPNYSINYNDGSSAGVVTTPASGLSILVCELPENVKNKITISGVTVKGSTYNTFIYKSNPLDCDSSDKVASMLLKKVYATSSGSNGVVSIPTNSKYICWDIQNQDSYTDAKVTFVLNDNTELVVDSYGGSVVPTA